MAVSKGARVASIVFGCLLLALTLISVICGGVAMGKMQSITVEVTIGLWTLYFVAPGILSIVAGYKKRQKLLVIAMGIHILGIIFAGVGAYFAADFWAVLSENCRSTRTLNRVTIKNSDFCSCTMSRRHKKMVYAVTCGDLATVRTATAVITIAYGLLAIISLVGSTYDCFETCCEAGDPSVVVIEGRQPATVITNTQASDPAYNMQPSPLSGNQEQAAASKIYI